MDSWRTTSPLKLAEMTAFTLPLPSYFSIPAMANGAWSSPVTSTPSWAIRYVPCSVALEHFAPAEFSSSANPVPTASTPTRPTTPNTTNRAARYLFMRFVPPCFVGAHVTSAAYSCERGGRITQLQYLLQLSSPTAENAQTANFGEFYEGEVRRIPIPRTQVNKGKRKGRGCFAPALLSYVSPRCCSKNSM